MAQDNEIKPLEFRGSSRKDFLEFPAGAVVDGGYQLFRVQSGQDPDDWKAVTTVGHGCFEIRIDEGRDTFRIIYIAKLADAIFVLHCFQKTTRKTAQKDIDLAKDRYRDMLKEMKL